jgi:hypothetical protein
MTAVMILLSHHVMTFLHEWTHSSIAYFAGYKNSPFNIHYATNWITLWGIDEAVPYDKILAEGKHFLVATIAIAPMISGAIFFLIGLRLLSLRYIQKSSLCFSFFYWWTLMEIAEIYSYIPVRTFAKRDDIFNFLRATGVSPWTVLIPGILFVAWSLQRMIRIEEDKACKILRLEGKINRFAFLLITLLICFWYYGGFAFIFVYPGVIKNVFSWISLALIPFCLITLRKRYLKE